MFLKAILLLAVFLVLLFSSWLQLKCCCRARRWACFNNVFYEVVAMFNFVDGVHYISTQNATKLSVAEALSWNHCPPQLHRLVGEEGRAKVRKRRDRASHSLSLLILTT